MIGFFEISKDEFVAIREIAGFWGDESGTWVWIKSGEPHKRLFHEDIQGFKERLRKAVVSGGWM